MKTNTEPLKPETFYHIYNRGINSEDLFKRKRNYSYFLEKYEKLVSPVVETYAYVLLKNHFHFLVRTRSEEEIRNFQPAKVGYSAERMISLQLSHLFNTYAQAINKGFKRTGGLFETPFRRIEISNDEYFTHLIKYIHLNPQTHGFIDNFAVYQYSSYQTYLSNKRTFIERNAGLDWFGGRAEFVEYHQYGPDKDSNCQPEYFL